MAGVRKRTFTLIAWPWEDLRWVRVPDGLEFTLYEVLHLEGLGLRVAATAAEEERWRQAYEACHEELLGAQREVRWAHGVRTRARLMADSVAVRLWRYDLIPGRKARSRRAWAECEARMRAADAAYRPVRAEIEARLAEAAARDL